MDMTATDKALLALHSLCKDVEMPFQIHHSFKKWRYRQQHCRVVVAGKTFTGFGETALIDAITKAITWFVNNFDAFKDLRDEYNKAVAPKPQPCEPSTFQITKSTTHA